MNKKRKISRSAVAHRLKRSYHKTAPVADVVTTTIGFIRVRKRKLKGAYRYYSSKDKRKTITHSTSYDLVRAVRFNSEPRHKFVLGFGSPASASKYVGERRGVALFWMHSFDRMGEHGFSKEQRFHIAEMLAGKGVPLPTVYECQKEKTKNIQWRLANPGWGTDREAKYDELIVFIKQRESPKRSRRRKLKLS